MVLTGARLLATAQAYHLSGGNPLNISSMGITLVTFILGGVSVLNPLKLRRCQTWPKKKTKKKKTPRPMVRERAHWDLITRDSLSNYLMTLMAGLKPAGDFWVRFPPKKNCLNEASVRPSASYLFGLSHIYIYTYFFFAFFVSICFLFSSSTTAAWPLSSSFHVGVVIENGGPWKCDE